MQNRIREWKCESSQFMRVLWYTVRRNGKRQKKFAPTSEAQAKVNERNKQRHLSDLIHLNFTPGDLAVHPTYEDRFYPADWEEHTANLRNFIRRLKRAWAKKTGRDFKEFRYILVSAQSSTGRMHAHLIISGGMDEREIAAVWGMGYVNRKQLEFNESGLVGLANYIIKPKERVNRRSFSTSKNLEKPDPHQKNDYKITQKDARHVDENPLDWAYIEEKYPGWSVAWVNATAENGEEEDVGEKKAHPFGHFIEIMLYKTDNKYFKRDKWGRITYDWSNEF